jgi:hypothetical protein
MCAITIEVGLTSREAGYADPNPVIDQETTLEYGEDGEICAELRQEQIPPNT